MKIIKTKKEVVIDSIEIKSAVVYVVVKEIFFNGLAFSAIVEYFIIQNGKERTIKITSTNFSIDEATQLENSLGVVGTTVSERLTDLAAKATMYKLGALGIFGLDETGFEYHN